MTRTGVNDLIVDLSAVGRHDAADVGGKAANLGELIRAGFPVPDGFCVRREAFRRFCAANDSVASALDHLRAVLDAAETGDDAAVVAAADGVRVAIDAAPVDAELAEAVRTAVGRWGDDTPVAVRSSSAAEDSAAASFAGQHESFLNVVGIDAVLASIRRCWASAFSPHAVVYRRQHVSDTDGTDMAVVVQAMVDASAAGVVFTADPISSHRRVAVVEAVAGLGDALVAGTTDADGFTVRDGVIMDRRSRVGASPALDDAEVIDLVALARTVADHFGVPQDIEWCLDRTRVQWSIVQSRPITTLFPIPDNDGQTTRVYVSVGHQQMMTDPMRPLGLSLWLMTTPAPMVEAGGRLFVDVTPRLASAPTAAALLEVFGRGDPLVRDAMEEVLARGDIVTPAPASPAPGDGPAGGPPTPPPMIDPDPDLVAELVRTAMESLAIAHRDMAATSGLDAIEFIAADMAEMRRLLFEPRSTQVIMAGMDAMWWLKAHLSEWLDDDAAADALALSAPGNITAEMGMALMDLADVIRPYPAVTAYLAAAQPGDGLEGMADLDGGTACAAAFDAYLTRFGMRCEGEIDVTRPRWAEAPEALFPALVANIANFEPGEAARRFDAGQRTAENTEIEVLDRVRALVDGEAKAAETALMIDRVRTFIGYREFPKYAMICRYFMYKQAMWREGARLAAAGAIDAVDDIGFLRFDELREAVATGIVDRELIDQRRQAMVRYAALTPSRVMTSDGEIFTGRYRRDAVPAGALVGIGVSAGTVEGRARVIADLAGASIEPGDIVVTTHTDPSWSPLFLVCSGLVTEVGGVMTHGAVVAREYGLPAVVGVTDATTQITDGQWIRLDGSAGIVTVIDPPT